MSKAKCWCAMLAVFAAGAALAAEPLPKVRHAYTASPYGELHYAYAEPAMPTGRPPLVLIHQAMNSSVEFGNLVPEMGRDRMTIALDMPSYGGSEGPDSDPTVEEYADAVAFALKALGYGPGRPVDILGLHTGAFTAGEVALRHPKQVRRIVLVGEWIVPESERLRQIARLPRYKTNADFFDWVAANNEAAKNSTLRKNIGDADWGRVYVESLRPLTRREQGHGAIFDYAARARKRIALIKHPALLMAIDDGVRGPTIEAKAYMPTAVLLDLPHIKEGAFFTQAEELGIILRRFLDDPSEPAG